MARGHLTQRGKDTRKWALRVELDPDPATGKRRQKRMTFRGTKRDAEAALAKFVTAARAGQVADAGRLTVAQLLTRYVADREEPKTRRGYAQLARNQITPLIGNLLVERLASSHVSDFKAALRTLRRKDKPTETIATRTQLKAFRLLHAALEEAVRWRLIPVNPAAPVKPPSATTREMHPLDRAQAVDFAAELARRETFWHAFFLLGLATGMRLAELVGLRWSDVKLDQERVEVRQTVAYVDGEGSTEKGQKGRVFKAYPKSRRARVLPIDPDLVAVLRAHRAVQVARQLHAGPLWKDLDLCFPGPLGRPLDDTPIRTTLDRVCKAAGVPRITPHDLRHTMATLALLDGINVRIVSERLGHATVSITMNIYSHVLPGLQEDAALRIGRLLRGAG